MTEQCRLIQGWFALFIQGLLGFMCILTLVVKRHNEVPQRNWIVWSLDALKQGLGSTFGHFANIVLAVVINLDAFVVSYSVDECEWYCLSYLVDSTFGITLNLMMLTFVENITKRNIECSRYVKFGEYGNPPMMSLFLPQLSIWLFIVIFTKCVTYSMQLYFAEPLGILMNYLLFSVQSSPKLELVVVMIIIPVTVNSLQFWVTDMFLKGAHAHDGSGNNHNSDHRHDDDNAIMINNNSNHSSDGSSNNSYTGLTTASSSNTSNNNNNDFLFPELLSPRSLDRAKKRLKRLRVKERGSDGAVVQMTDYEFSDALLLSKEEGEEEDDDNNNYIGNYNKTSNNNHNFINENSDKSLLSPNKQKSTISQTIHTNNNQNNGGSKYDNNIANNNSPKQQASKTPSTLNSNSTSSYSNSPNHMSNGNNNGNSSNSFSRYTLQNLNSNNNNDSISSTGNYNNNTGSGNNRSYSININNNIISSSPVSTPIASIATSNHSNNNNADTTFTVFPTFISTTATSPSSSYR